MFKEIYNKLPKEIVKGDKHYVLTITPFDISYIGYNNERQYIIYKIVNANLSIGDSYERLIDNMKRMLTVI